MIVEIDEITINLLTEEKRVEIRVRTTAGELIVFPRAQVEVRDKDVGGRPLRTIYAHARVEVTSPQPCVYVLLVEDEECGAKRESLQRLDL